MIKNIIYTTLGFTLAFIVCDFTNHGEKVQAIEHIQNVDEMQETPKELYFFTAKGKYFFDGKKIELVTEYKN